MKDVCVCSVVGIRCGGRFRFSVPSLVSQPSCLFFHTSYYTDFHLALDKNLGLHCRKGDTTKNLNLLLIWNRATIAHPCNCKYFNKITHIFFTTLFCNTVWFSSNCVTYFSEHHKGLQAWANRSSKVELFFWWRLKVSQKLTRFF